MGTNYKVIGKWFLTLLVIVGTLIPYGDTIPVRRATDPGSKGSEKPLQPPQPPQPSFDEEQQLKDLKQSLGKTFSILKSQVNVQYFDQNGNRGTELERNEEANEDGQLVARLSQKLDSIQAGGENATPSSHVGTEVEIPSRGIHKIVESPLGHGQREIAENIERRSPPHISNQMDGKYTSFSGVQYSPRDMAEYVFWTGDEKGVTLAVEEFLEDGLMTRKDAISFLQEIKTNLDDLQLHYSRQQRFQKHDETEADQEKGRIGSRQRSVSKKNTDDKEEAWFKELPADSKNSPRVPPIESSVQLQDDQEVSTTQLQRNRGISDEDYDELLDRLKVADFLYTEYSLEEVIYQLAKVIFSQSLTKGSADAQEALQKFTNFLESEAERGHISKSLEKKVLDVLIASFADTIAEHPELIAKSRSRDAPPEAQSHSANQLLHQLVMLNPRSADTSVKPEKALLGKQQSKLVKQADPEQSASEVKDDTRYKSTKE